MFFLVLVLLVVLVTGIQRGGVVNNQKAEAEDSSKIN